MCTDDVVVVQLPSPQLQSRRDQVLPTGTGARTLQVRLTLDGLDLDLSRHRLDLVFAKFF